MTEQEIEFNYKKAMGQASELKEIASSLKKLGESQLDSCMNSVAKNWTGDNSDSYVKKGRKLEKKMVTSSDNIKQTAETIETMAKNIYEAEMKALQEIRDKSYA